MEDRHGVIAPWYKGQNGQFDYRVRIAAETLKRYPWVDKSRAVMPGPEYLYNGKWDIARTGQITVLPEEDWNNGDLVQRAAITCTAATRRRSRISPQSPIIWWTTARPTRRMVGRG